MCNELTRPSRDVRFLWPPFRFGTVAVCTLIAANLVMGYRLWRHTRTRVADAGLEALVSARADLQSLPIQNRPTMVMTVANPATWDVTQLLVELAATIPMKEMNVIIVARSQSSELSRLLGGYKLQAVVIPGSVALRTGSDLIDSWNRWFVFNRHGERVTAGNAARGGLLGAVQLVAGVDAGLPARLANHLSEAGRTGDLVSSAGIGAVNRSILFIRRANTTCGTAPALASIETAWRSGNKSVAVWVPHSWTAADISAFRWTFDLTLPIDTASAGFSRRWSALERVYGRQQTAAFFVTIEKRSVTHLITEQSDIMHKLESLYQ
jgi:hypothetical protein